MNETERELRKLLFGDLRWLMGECEARACEGEWWGGARRNLWLADQHLRFLDGERGLEHALHAMRRMADALALIVGEK